MYNESLFGPLSRVKAMYKALWFHLLRLLERTETQSH